MIFWTVPSPEGVTIQSPILKGRSNSRIRPATKLLTMLWRPNPIPTDSAPALMARLGPVRAALDGHGGGLVVTEADIEEMHSGGSVLSLILDLDGACVSCGAAPDTLKGIQDDLLMDQEVIAVRFTVAMLEWFDELQRDFVLKHGGVVFV